MSRHGHAVPRKTADADARVSSGARRLRVMRKRGGAAIQDRERYYLASGWQLLWRKFRRHHLAVGVGSVLALLFVTSLFANFFTPYSVERRFANHHPPSRIRLLANSGRFPVRPFVYGITS